MAKEKMNKEERTRRVIKTVATLSIIFFGIRLVLMVLFSASSEFREALGGVLGMVFQILLLMAGLVAAINLLKIKKWALITLTTIFGLELVIRLLAFFFLQSGANLPVMEGVLFALNLTALFMFKHIKNKNDKKNEN